MHTHTHNLNTSLAFWKDGMLLALFEIYLLTWIYKLWLLYNKSKYYNTLINEMHFPNLNILRHLEQLGV